MLASGQCEIMTFKSETPTLTCCQQVLQPCMQSATGQSSRSVPLSSVQIGRTVLCLLRMDPQCTHILNSYIFKNGYKWDLFIIFFCSFLSRMDLKEYDGKAADDNSHAIDTNLTLFSVFCRFYVNLFFFCGMLVNTNAI